MSALKYIYIYILCDCVLSLLGLPFRPAPAAVAPNEAEHNVDICSKPPDLSLRKPAADMASSNVSKFKLNSLVIEFNEIVLKTLKAGGPFHNNGIDPVDIIPLPTEH